jgi:hypothetical protein
MYSCQEETEQDPWDQAAGRDKVEAAGEPAARADPLRRDRQVPACARSAGKGKNINGEFLALSGNARSAGP